MRLQNRLLAACKYCDVSSWHFPTRLANVCFRVRVQPVTATLLVVYRQGFRSPRSSAGVAHCQDRPAKHSASITRAGPQMSVFDAVFVGCRPLNLSRFLVGVVGARVSFKKPFASVHGRDPGIEPSRSAGHACGAEPCARSSRRSPERRVVRLARGLFLGRYRRGRPPIWRRCWLGQSAVCRRRGCD